MSDQQADSPAIPRLRRLDRHVLWPFLALGLVATALCLADWTGIVSPFFEPLVFMLSGLAGGVGLALVWLRVKPIVANALAREDAVRAVDEGQFARVAGGDSNARPGAHGPFAYTDALTGLGNRARMMEKFNRLVESRKGGSHAFTVGLMNLDGMKPINDLFGTAGGDDIIRQCGLRLAAAVDEDGFVCRYGGDEFGFIFPQVSDAVAAEERGRLLQDLMLAPFHLEGRTVRLSGSLGLAVHPGREESFETTMANIETALYHSKRRGRGRVTLYNADIEELVRENARIELALRNAIASNEVKPCFQPIISLQDGRLLGFEALARWVDPDLGFVSPSRFIALAEERGIIFPLTESLLMQAALAAADWPDDLFLSFNLSSLQLVDLATAAGIKDVIRRAGLAPHRLEIEVTETAVMSDPETAAMIIDELHEAGIRISMDDFGTGQSSLGRLRELKLDKVKIDRTFVKAIGEDKAAEHIIRAILELCVGLELTVVAEGIEKLAQAESLRRYGCHAGQGFLFGRPQDARKTMAYIRDFLAKSQPQDQSQVA